MRSRCCRLRVRFVIDFWLCRGLLCCFGCWLRRALLRFFGFVLRRELLLDLARDRGHIYLVELGGFVEGFGGFGWRVGRLENGDFDQNPAEGALIGFAQKGREQLGRGVGGSVGLADAVKAQQDWNAALVQRGGKALGDEEQVALHQPDGNGVARCFQDAKTSRLGDGLFAAALLLLGLECCVVRGRCLRAW